MTHRAWAHAPPCTVTHVPAEIIAQDVDYQLTQQTAAGLLLSSAKRPVSGSQFHALVLQQRSEFLAETNISQILC